MAHFPAGSISCSLLADRIDPFDSFEQGDSHCLSWRLSDRLEDLSLYGQFVVAISQCHKRALEWASVDGPLHLHQPARAKERGRFGPDDVGPATGLWASDDRRCEGLVQHVCLTRGIEIRGLRRTSWDERPAQLPSH